MLGSVPNSVTHKANCTVLPRQDDVSAGGGWPVEASRARPTSRARCWITSRASRAARAVDGTCVFVDVSGFTRLSERLARRGGREGAEQLADAIGGCFERLLGVAYAKGGGLLKFGGDALLLLFDGDAHAERGLRERRRDARRAARGGRDRDRPAPGHAAHVGRRPQRRVPPVRGRRLAPRAADRGPGRQRGRADGEAGGRRRDRRQRGDGRAAAGRCLGAARGAGRLLRAPPPILRIDARTTLPADRRVGGRPALSTELRAHVLAGPQPPEHRIVTVAFLRFEGTDGLVAERGPEGAADALRRARRASSRRRPTPEQVCFLGSDIDADGGKLILTAGAPRALGDEDERMLLALRRIVEAGPPLPLRIGVTRGPLFAGDIGPRYRRTYTVMGDVVNLAARLMAKAPPARSTRRRGAGTLEHAFETTELEPFPVKGKALPVEAVAVGPWCAPRVAARARAGALPADRPRARARADRGALDDARRGRGRLIELVSEPGMGRSRLMEEVRDRAGELRVLHATCEPYTMRRRTRPGASCCASCSASLGRPDERRAGAAAGDARARRSVAAAVAAAARRRARRRGALRAPAVEQLAPEFRAARLREVVLRFMRRQLPAWALIEVADAHLMDTASAELVEALARELPLLPWLVVVSRRDREGGFTADARRARAAARARAARPADALALAEAVTEAAPLPPHVVALAAERSGGSPQFLRDLLRAAAAGSTELPDSIESAALARLDRLAPADRALIRRASVLG